MTMLLLWSQLISFFWGDDEEKQLRNLLQSAEAAIKKENFAEAKETYEELIDRIGVNTAQKYSVDWPTYVDIIIRFANTCEELNEVQEGEKALSRLLSAHPPEEHLPRIRLQRARLISKLKTPGTAFNEMSMIAQNYPIEKWSKEDITFFHALEYSLNSHYDQLVRKAKHFLVTGYFNEAITLYEEILQAIETRYYPKACQENSLILKKLRYRLAESHYNQAHYEQSLALCYNSQVVEDRIDREMLYLSALCYQARKEFKKALEIFQNYTHLGKREDLDHYDHALFEIALFYYQAGNIEQARTLFQQLQQFEGKPKNVAALYLAKMHLQEGAPEEVEGLIQPIVQNLSRYDPLRYECYFLQGEAAYALNKYAVAKEFFEQALPPKKNSGEWTEQASFHLGWCYLRLGEEEKSPSFFSKAEEIFTTLLQTKKKEEAALALGNLNLLLWHHFEDPEALKKIETLLLPFRSLDAFLIRAEAASTYVEKEALLREATASEFHENPSYADAWYARGLNHFQEGLKNPTSGYEYFDQAAAALGKSFQFLALQSSSKAAHILKLEAKANFYRNSPISSLALLEKLLSQFNESVEEREETLYLRGLIATRLLDLSYFSIAEESLLAVGEGNGKYHDEALYTLGILYYGQEYYDKAKEIFLRLAQGTPTSPFASEAWFWAAGAAEKKGDPDHMALRAHVYQDYPHSAKAAEAYFRQYPYDAYLNGEDTSLNHLRAFPDRFPHSPLLVVIYYLLGMSEKGFDSAKDEFEEAIKAFPFCLEEGKIPNPAFVYFRYQAMLELAQLALDSNEAFHLLNTIVSDFSTPDHPLTSLLKLKSPYPSLFIEAEYALAKIYLKRGKKLRAQERFAKMLAHFEEAGIQKGSYLSLVWREQGKLSHQCGDYDTALRCFGISEECGREYLSEEQKLSLWLLQSHSHRGKKEYGTAMLLLSKVINTDITSPLRLQAMFYRAELYELQGRPELAVRQLEAMSKKGGDWGMQALNKLRKEYGM